MTRLKTSLLTIAMLLCSLASSAHDFEVDGIYYNITSDSDLTVSVTFQGDSYNSYSKEYSGAVVIPEKVTCDSKEYSVTSIEQGAFRYCSGLTSVTIPNSVTSIGARAFYVCSGLTGVTIPNSVTSIGDWAFSGCSSLTTIEVESGNTKYDSRDNCKAIIETTTNTLISGCMNTIIPNSVTSIGDGAFFGCSGLTSVTIPNSVTSIGDDAFSGCSGLVSVDIPNSVTSIGDWAFSSCSVLTSVTIGNSVTSIGRDAFSRCSGLTSVTIPNSVTSIGRDAFYGCSGLTSVDIPNSVTSIGDWAFSRCSSLTSVTIGNSVTSIGRDAFSRCSSLTSLKVDSGNVKYDSRNNCNAIIDTNTNTLYIGCKNTVIPNTVTSIGENAFSGCLALTNVTIPNSVISIGNYAFWNCSGLTNVPIPNSVTSIGQEAFSGCSSLTSVTIPKSVTSIGSSAFEGTGWYNNQSDGVLYLDNWLIDYKGTMPANTSVIIKDGTKGIANYVFSGCSSLTSVTIPKSVTSIGSSAFLGCSSLSSVDIPNSVTSIGSEAFRACSGLTSVTIPNSVTSIGEFAFQGCSGLTTIEVESGNTKYDSRDNCNAIIETNTNTLIVGCKNTVIPNSVTSIGRSAFSFCLGLTSVTIPDSVAIIGDSAFRGCYSLTSVTISDSVAIIGDYAFYYCSDLTSVTIPNSVTSIGKSAFLGCNSLTSVTVEHSTPLPVEYNTFVLYQNGEPTTNNATLYVPYGSAAAYQSSEGWSTFTRIEEMPGAQFIIPETAAYPDEQFSLPVEMSNTAELTAFQCDVYIPEGLTLQTDDKGRYDITLSSERCDDHTLSALLQSDGSIRIAMYSMSTSPILGTEGPLFTLNMSAGEDLSAYEVQIKNIHASDASGKLYSMADVTGTVTVDYRAGDANGDGMVAVNDVVYTVNKILNNAAEDFIFSAADMNDDNEIMINDVVMIVNTILGTSTTTAALAPRHMNAFETLGVADSKTAYGMTEFGITLSNASRYTAMQFDMELADGADIADIKVSMPTDHSVAYRRIDDTTVRVVVTSLTNEALAEGAQLCVSMKDAAGKTVAFTNGRAACNNGQMVGIMPGRTVLGGTTGIEGVNTEFAPADVYSIDGRIVKKNATTLDGLKPGVYVVNGRKVVKS